MYRMYKILIVLLILPVLSQAQNDAIVTYFSSEMENDLFKHAYISPRMINAVVKMDVEDMDEDIRMIVKDLKGMRILSSDKDGKNQYSRFIKELDSQPYEVIVSSRTPAESVKIYLKNEGQPDGELIMVYQTNETCSITSISGLLDLEKIAKLSRQLNIKGAEFLEDVNRK